MTPHLAITLGFAAIGALFALLAVPLTRAAVPRNRLYGFRTPKTLSSDRIWYRANRHAGRGLLAAALVLMAGSLALARFGARLPEATLTNIELALLIVPLLLSVVSSLGYLRRL